jgi:hypothetical protein
MDINVCVFVHVSSGISQKEGSIKRKERSDGRHDQKQGKARRQEKRKEERARKKRVRKARSVRSK